MPPILAGARRTSALAEGHEVVAPGGQPALGVQPRRQPVEAGRTVEVVLDVVLAGPQQLHRRADRLGDPRRLDHEVVHQPPAEAAAAAGEVDGDVLGLDPQGLGHQLAAVLGVLGRGPDLDLAILEAGRAVLRLQRARGR